MEEKHLLETEENQNILLTTIRVPKNIHFLTDRLPKANYTPLRTRQIDKTRFLATLAGYKNVSNESHLHAYEDRLMKGSESVDTHKKDMLPNIKGNREDIFKVYNANQRKKPLPIHKANLGELNEKSLIQNEQDLLVQKLIEAEQRRGREKIARQHRGISEQPAKHVLREIDEDPMSMEPPTKRLGYAVHNLNDDVIFDENSGGYGKNPLNPKKGGGSERRPPRKLDKLDGHENSPYAERKMRAKAEAILDAYRPEKNQQGLPAINPLLKKAGKLPSIAKQPNPILQNYESPYKTKPKDAVKPYRANLGNVNDLLSRNHLVVGK